MTDVFEDAVRLWGRSDVDTLFAGHDQVLAPWPRLPSRKGGPKTPSAAQILEHPATLTRVDPRALWSTQPWVLRHHVVYYLTGDWERTGRTAADQHKIANRYPLVVADAQGRLAILVGHHRAAAALIDGRELWVRSADPGAVAVLPHLWVVAPGGDPGLADVGEAVRVVNSGRVTVLASASMAVPVMVGLGLEPTEVEDRLRVAGL